ncbi:sigma-70 family RNA polymerase sigma factor [Aquihabitans sp. McL0605]|uniref:sigma-70 family RNA polymerase sigma factor n=1 Tax=Aquihabitans sp. McL0605 TaxID=3415671 RepID=UPI003CF64C03
MSDELVAAPTVELSVVDLGPEAFCRDIHPRLVGSLRLYLGDVESARELAQDALVRVVERWPQVAVMDHPQAWTYRVAFNLARSRLRRTMAESRARRRADAPPTSSWGVDVADVLAVRAAVHQLAPRQRQAIVLRFYSDLTVDQIGEAMGCRPGTVKAHLHQALRALRSAGLATDDDLLVVEPTTKTETENDR